MSNIGNTNPYSDAITPFHVEALNVRGRVVRLGAVLDTILGRHSYPDAVSRLLAEVIVLTAMLGSSLKFDGKFILQTQSDGPVSLLVVDFRTPDKLRAYAKYDEDRVEQARVDGSDQALNLLGKGVLVMTVDQGANAARYQGIVQLQGDNLEDVARDYFKQSEQIPTELRMAVAQMVTRDADGNQIKGWRAGGMEVQFLPESNILTPAYQELSGDGAKENSNDSALPDTWVEARSLVSTLSDIELVDPDLDAGILIHRLFNQHDYVQSQTKSVIDQCACSRDKLKSVLAGFSREEIGQCVEDGEIVANCEFCSTDYHFDPAEFVESDC